MQLIQEWINATYTVRRLAVADSGEHHKEQI